MLPEAASAGRRDPGTDQGGRYWGPLLGQEHALHSTWGLFYSKYVNVHAKRGTNPVKMQKSQVLCTKTVLFPPLLRFSPTSNAWVGYL